MAEHEKHSKDMGIAKGDKDAGMQMPASLKKCMEDACKKQKAMGGDMGYGGK